MALAVLHPQQTERLDSLRSYEILDTDPEKAFDEIVRLAAALCGTEMALISFVDADRQWFKATEGTDLDQSPLDGSICSHAILQDGILEIPDTLADPRTVDNPLVCGEPGLRFYAGAVLATPEGLPLGTLCVLDRTPRVLTPLQRDTLRVLAQQVMARLELRRALARADVLRREADHRVKNSLHSLSAFLRLGARRATSDETRAAIEAMQARIEAVAALHHELYRSEPGKTVDLSAYIDKLGGYLHKVVPPHVTLLVETVAVAVSSLQAVAVGTLVNEFVANSVKHAFPDNRAGQIAVRIARGDGPDEVMVTCSDDGVGLPEGSGAPTGGLGLQVAAVISAELNARLDAGSSRDGMRLSVTFRSEG
jgi:two-component sensor histidine kinase